MFAVCTSVEFDLKKFITNNPNQMEINDELKNKAKSRNKQLISQTFTTDNIQVLNELDMGDLIQIIHSNPYAFELNQDKMGVLNSYFSKIIPIRNRVMHTRPLEVGDRSLLTEVLENIPSIMPWISWKETVITREKIRNKPHEIFNQNFKKPYEYESNVYHNLPQPEFDDTGYIGRRKEIKEIIELINDNKNQVITILGNGGIGKTATAVKALYDLLDDLDNRFEAIIWISLKTKTLSHGEFKNIKASIKDLESFYINTEKMVIKEDKTAKENILNFMEEFNTLLVLDNLETISTAEIMEFLKEIPENSKVLITSRHGVGELERRYPLNGLDIKDAITYFRILSQHYGLDLHKRPEEDLKKIIVQSLYSSPLSIKWFISSIYTGISEESILANKADLIIFCMSNVVDILNDDERKILQLLLVEGKKLSYGEIDYFLKYDENILIKGLNNLVSTSMIQLQNGVYELNQMAKDYLSLSHPPSNDFLNEVMKNRSTLNLMMQEIKIKNENDPFNPKSIYKNLENDNKRIASYYLMEALDFSYRKKWDESFKSVRKAADIAPDYFEVYKIKAFIAAENKDWYEAINSYRIAVESCVDEFERASVLYLFSVFYTVKMENFESAKELILEAVEIFPDNNTLKIEKARVLTYLGEFHEAEEILDTIVVDDTFTEKGLNLFISRFADLYQRMAQNYQTRDYQKKLVLYKNAILKIESLNVIDPITYQTLSKILAGLSYLYFDEESMKLLYSTLEKHFQQLSGMSGNNLKKMARVIDENRHVVPRELHLLVKKLSINYIQLSKNITNENEGMIVRIISHYGFIHNSFSSYYFNLSQVKYESPEAGDIVCFDMIKNQKGETAINIKFIKKIEIE